MIKNLFLLLFVSVGCIYAQNTPVSYVNTLIGSHDSRWIMFPGPSRPFGMVKLSPDNQIKGWKAGYEYDIHSISGFSHLHSWTMAGISLMPTTGKLITQPGSPKNPESGYRSKISHDREVGSPGYYFVHLDDYDVDAELTTTTRAGFHKYTFPASDSAHVLIDLKIPSEYGYEISYAHIKTVNNYELEGMIYQQSLRHANYNDYILHFVIRADTPFDSMDGWVEDEIFTNENFISSGFEDRDLGAFLNYKTSENQTIQLQVGVSLVSIDQARLNLESELNPFNWNFADVVEDSQNEWNKLLSLIEAETDDVELKTKFYTNLYRSYVGRTTWSDFNGKYVDMYERTQELPFDTPLYGSDGFWITFWNLNPLWSLVTPQIANNWVRSMLEIYDKGGWLPKGPTGIEYSGIMVASHQISLLTNAYHKGIRNYDVNKLYEAIVKLQKTQGHAHDAGGYVGNRNLDDYLKYGFVPDDAGPVSNTLAYAYDDWTVAQMALALNKEKDYKEFTKRAFNYRNVFDTTNLYMRRKNRDSSWASFSKYGDVAWLGSGFVEGNAWQYSFFVPHDINGLVKLMGKDTFNSRLEEGFKISAKHKFNSEHLGSNSLEGMGILPVNHGNQPNMQAAYLFNYSGKPWLTQKWVNEIMNNYYGAGPDDGWLGDEDQGQMGAWFAMSAIGLFEMDGGTSTKPFYEIGSPRFKKITIHLDTNYYTGEKFIIEANHVSPSNIYIQKATLNDIPLNQPWFYHEELVNGGKLVLEMGPKPNKNWGLLPESAPPSMSTLITNEEKENILNYNRQLEELEEWNKAVKAYYFHRKTHFESLANTPHEIIFLGNSITDGAEWFELFDGNPNIKNRGIGGDDTYGILNRLEEITSSSPDKIFLMIGTNDLAYGKTSDDIINNYKSIIEQIEKSTPTTRLYIQSILPVDDAIHFTRPNQIIEEINMALRKICKSKNIPFIDLDPIFKDHSGKLDKKYSFDGLHLNGEGYILWSKMINKHITE